MNFGFNPLSISGGLSFTRILGSISKTLGIIRSIAPIYQDIKPAIKKAPLILERISNLRNNINTFKTSPSNYMQTQETLLNDTPSYGPNFFK